MQEIANILRINRTKAYELTHREDFSSLKLGQRIIVHRNKFFEWLDKVSEKRLNKKR
ncbi:MAG: helix-turn-helix domain-containing protein [Bacillota bacterium]